MMGVMGHKEWTDAFESELARNLSHLVLGLPEDDLRRFGKMLVDLPRGEAARLTMTIVSAVGVTSASVVVAHKEDLKGVV